MTTAAAHPLSFGVWWRQRWPAVLLIASLALNLFFVAGAVWIHLHAPPSPAARLHEMAGELKLDEKQNAAFQDYIRALRARVELMRQATDPTISAAWAELAKPDADQGKVMQLFDEANQKRHAMQRELTSQTIAFLATLSAEQRNKFVSIWRERRGPLFRRGPGDGH